ncbi:MAG: RAMP superfamily CRISPR-associated protein [Rhizobiaceae bacterium]
MSERREYRLTLAVVSPFLFQGVVNTRLGVDAAFLREVDGRPVIPAAQIRGVLRAALEAMLDRGYTGISVPDLFGKGSIEGGNAAGEVDAPERGALIFSDLVGPAPHPGRETTRIAIDDETGAVERGMLQVIELAAPPGTSCEFTGKVILRLPDSAAADRAEKALSKALRLIPAIGAIKSAGFGAVDPAKAALKRLSAIPLRPAAGVLPPLDRQIVFDVTFDRPILVDSRRVTDNMFAGSTIVPGAAFKGAVAERLRLAGLAPDKGDLGKALAATRFSHAFPMVEGARGDLALPMSIVCKGKGDFADISGWARDVAPLDGDEAADFLVTAKDEVKASARKTLRRLKSEIRRLARTHVKIDGAALIADDAALYSTEMVAAKDQTWRMSVDFGDVADVESTKTILAAVSGGIDGIGRTGATATLSPVDAPHAPWKPAASITLLLETPALLFDGAAAANSMYERYAAYFRDRLGGAVLENFFARRRMAGGYQPTRYRAYGKAYYPFILTEPGSVFRLTLPDDVARNAVMKALRFGLPAADLDGKAVDWTTCPFVPENGYGEISEGIPLTDAGLTKAGGA